MSRLEINTLPDVGAEVTGVDLRTLSDAEFAQIRAAFNARGLLFFRDQNLSEEEHIALAGRFGKINVNRSFAAHPAYTRRLRWSPRSPSRPRTSAAAGTRIIRTIRSRHSVPFSSPANCRRLAEIPHSSACTRHTTPSRAD